MSCRRNLENRIWGARWKPCGKNNRARRLAKGCEQQQPCARVAGSSSERSRAERPSDLNIEENPRAAGLRRRPELLVSTCRKKLQK